MRLCNITLVQKLQCCAICVANLRSSVGVIVGVAASGLGSTAAASQSIAGQTLTSHCASPGYVFIPCQQPSNDKQEIEVYGVDESSSFLQLCNEYLHCAAYTTEGLFYSVSADTVKVGPFKPMDSCHNGQPTQSIGTAAQDTSHCKGTYVFDGDMVREKPQPRHAGPRASKVSVVASALRSQYVRQAASGGGVGKVGREQCMLC